MSKKKKQFVAQFRASDGRKGTLCISFKDKRLEIYADVEGSNRLRKIGEYHQLGITLGDYEPADINRLFQVLSL